MTFIHQQSTRTKKCDADGCGGTATLSTTAVRMCVESAESTSASLGATAVGQNRAKTAMPDYSRWEKSSTIPTNETHAQLRDLCPSAQEDLNMSNVIHVNFGSEREWEETHAKVIDGLVALGSLFGDDESLMRAKADSVYRILRQIVEEVPNVQITTKVPESLQPDQLELVTELVKRAAVQGIETTMTHAVQALMGSIYDLCTSKLAQRPQA